MIIHSWIYIINIFEINRAWLLCLPQLVMYMASFLPFTHSSFLWLFEHTKLIFYSGPLYLYRYTLYTSGSSCILLLHITQVLTQMSPLQGPSLFWVALMGHLVALCLIFWGITRLFPKVSAPFYMPTSRV